MKQLEDDKICKYCMGCNQLENENFDGVIKCDYFVTGRDNWYQNYIRAINERKNNNG